MNREGVEQLLPLIGSRKQPAGRSGWVIGSCPFAEWRHSGGVDRHPSFGIKVNDKGRSEYHCFSCNSHGDLEDLVLELRGYGVSGLGEAAQLIARELEEARINPPDFEELQGRRRGPQVVPYPEDWLASFPRAQVFPEAMQYLEGRGVPGEMVGRLDLRFDTSKRRVCFPVRDWEYRLVGLHGRDITGTSYPYHAYLNPATSAFNKVVWYGEHWLKPERPVLLVESVFDLAMAIQVYPNTLCSLSVGIGEGKARRLSGILDIVTLYDYGTGGDSARSLLSKYLKGVALRHLRPTEAEGDPGNMTLERLREVLEGYLPLKGI